ncbi:MAG: hypothetical protein FWC34_10270 [Bacteroidetes bacterium]|nr:hypothetical protein [Bacteroidota bacterium]MCL2302129.1 hypothetical protein [Lentimicrobiaceae bacterium]
MKQTICLISIGILFFFTSCEKGGKVCNVSDPLTNLPWLSEIKNYRDSGIISYSISKAIFKDQKKGKRIEGFVVSDLHFYDGMTVYYNCSGKILCYVGGISGFMCNDYEMIKSEVIYVGE